MCKLWGCSPCRGEVVGGLAPKVPDGEQKLGEGFHILLVGLAISEHGLHACLCITNVDKQPA